MNYSLGNMLGGSNGSLNPDKLSLNLQFATDKTLTARKGPTPTFTRASTATFVGSDGLIQSAAINSARFDHDPVTLACRGLLIEESRTNLILQSEDFGTSWSAISATVSVNATTSPNGTVTGDKLIINSGVTTGRISQNTTLTGSHTFSAFLKASEWSWAFITPSAAVGGVWFNLSNGTIGTQQAGCVGSIVSYGNGWYRCSVTLTGTGVLSTTRIVPTNADNTNTAGDGTSGIFAWGAQLEAGSFPTSYIPTTTASVVRSLDVCSISSIASFYGSGVGTIFTGTQLNGASQLNRVCGFFAGANQVAISRLLNNTRAVTNGNAPNLTINSGTLASTLFVKSAFAFNTNDAAFANNGVSAGTSTSVGIPSVATFGIGTNGSQQIQSGTISEIKVFKKRLANAKLLTITV